VGQRVTENLFNAEHNVAPPQPGVVRGTAGLVVSEKVRTYPVTCDAYGRKSTKVVEE
jgi:hypothetical protein